MEVAGRVVVSLILFLPIVTQGADECHCAESSACVQYPDVTCTSCQQFWSGSNCQIYNLARGDLNSTRLSKGDSDPNIVVDGDREINVPQKCTVISDFTGTTASWTVILNRDHDIYRLRLYHYSGHAESLRVFEIKVNSQLCHRESRPTNPPSVMNITCGQPLTGSLVSISIPLSQFYSHTLALCEVEIYDCGDYWYGDLCDKRCSCIDANEICSKIDGSCQSGTRETTIASTTPPATTSQTSSTTPTPDTSSVTPAPTSTTPMSTPAPSSKHATSTLPGHPPPTVAVPSDKTITLGEIAGVVVGVVLGFAVIVAVIVVIAVRLRRSGRPKVHDTPSIPITMDMTTKPLPPSRDLTVANEKPHVVMTANPYSSPYDRLNEHSYDYITDHYVGVNSRAPNDVIAPNNVIAPSNVIAPITEQEEHEYADLNEVINNEEEYLEPVTPKY